MRCSDCPIQMRWRGSLRSSLYPLTRPDIRSHILQELRKFANIVLPVAIRIKNQFLGGGREAASQALRRNRDSARASPHACKARTAAQAGQHLAGVVLTAVIDDDHLIIIRMFPQHIEGDVNNFGNDGASLYAGKNTLMPHKPSLAIFQSPSSWPYSITSPSQSALL